MLLQIYKYSGWRTRSVRSATLVDEVEAETFPDDEQEFAAEHGGDFVEIAQHHFSER